MRCFRVIAHLFTKQFTDTRTQGVLCLGRIMLRHAELLLIYTSYVGISTLLDLTFVIQIPVPDYPRLSRVNMVAAI